MAPNIKNLKSYLKFARHIKGHPLNMRIKHSFMNTSKPTMYIRSAAIALAVLLGGILFSACGSSAATSAPEPSLTSLPTATPIPPSVTPSPTPTLITPAPPFEVWIDPAFPRPLRNAIEEADFLVLAEDAASAQVIISRDPGLAGGSWIYLAVAPFYSYAEEASAADLRSCWETGPEESHAFSRILVSEDTLDAFEFLWGPANPDCVELSADGDIPQILWLDADVLAIIPFEKIVPAFKILRVDAQDPLAKEFQRDAYPLAVHFQYQVQSGYQIDLEDYPTLTNYEPSKLSSIALTGVTAMVRDTAYIMDTQGITYPAGDIQDILTSADITHISNEIPFAEDCPAPDASQVSLRFCSADSYIELLDAVGTDIVELSGDHFGDWGPEAMLHTLDLYAQYGWTVYGGGANLAEGLAAVFLTHNDNQFAFIGCNGKGIDKYATATDDNPGAAKCDFDWMVAEIARLVNEGYIVIATMQHEEVDSFGSIALQRNDFRRLAEAGAVIVSGSQAHHPQAIEFTGSSFIHYGLGNLFFDQWYLAHYNPKSHINKDKAFIDLHYFYNGSYLGTRLIPLQFIDNARPRPMTAEERIPFLDEFYKFSLWNGEWIYLYSTGYMANRTNQ